MPPIPAPFMRSWICEAEASERPLTSQLQTFARPLGLPKAEIPSSGPCGAFNAHCQSQSGLGRDRLDVDREIG